MSLGTIIWKAPCIFSGKRGRLSQEKPQVEKRRGRKSIILYRCVQECLQLPSLKTAQV